MISQSFGADPATIVKEQKALRIKTVRAKKVFIKRQFELILMLVFHALASISGTVLDFVLIKNAGSYRTLS